QASPRVRTTLLLLLGTCVGLPLGLLRNLDSLTSFSAMSLVFYALLVLKIFGEAFPVLWSMTWWDKVVLWRHENLLSVLPIFAMALSCQPVIFFIFDTLNEPSLMRMNRVVNGAVQMCSIVYIMTIVCVFLEAFRGGGVLCNQYVVCYKKYVLHAFLFKFSVSLILTIIRCTRITHPVFLSKFIYNIKITKYYPTPDFRRTSHNVRRESPKQHVFWPSNGQWLGMVLWPVAKEWPFIGQCLANGSSGHWPPARGRPVIGQSLATLWPLAKGPLPAIGQCMAKICAACCIGTFDQRVHSGFPHVYRTEESKFTVLRLVTCRTNFLAEAQRRIEPPEPQEPQNDVVVKAVTPPVIKEPVVKEDRGLDPEALRKEDREIEDTKRKKAVADARPPSEPEAKKQEQLLEKIAEEQKAQKKILEDLQRELKQEIAKHKDSDSEKANKTAPKPDSADVQRPEVPSKQTEASAQNSNLQQHVQKDSSGPQAVLAPVQQNANQQPVRQEHPVQQNAVQEPVRQDVRPPVQPIVKQSPQQNAPRLIQQNVEQLKQQQALPAQQKDVRPIVEDIKPRGIDAARQPYNVFKPQEPVADKVILSNVNQNLPKNRGDIEEPVAKKVPHAGPAVEIPKVAEKLQQKLQKLSIPIQQLQAVQKPPQDGLPQAAVADDRPLAEKMSMDVKRDAPPISIPLIPAAAAVGEAAVKLQPKGQSEAAADGAVAPHAVVDQRKADVVADLSKSAANPQSVPEGLPSQVHVEAALAKNEIRK
ncbi:unnamed protein product, partial [Ixodes pacificus]